MPGSAHYVAVEGNEVAPDARFKKKGHITATGTEHRQLQMCDHAGVLLRARSATRLWGVRRRIRFQD